MFFHKQFEKFDPLSGDVPSYPFSYLPEIAYRGRALLQYRAPEQITAIAKRINSEIEGYFDDLKYIAISELKEKFDAQDDEFHRFFEWDGGTAANGRWLFKDGMEEELEIPTAENTSEVDALKNIIEKRDSCFFLPEGAPEPEPDEYPEGKDHELFAVLSLWLLADAILTPDYSKHSTGIAADYAIKAMDAVCYAEHLREAQWIKSYVKKCADAELTQTLKAEFVQTLKRQQDEFQNVAQNERRTRSKELNKLRHTKNHEARQIVTEAWEKKPSAFISAEKAGLYFADWLGHKGFRYEPRTVTNWIRAHAKSKGIRLR